MAISLNYSGMFLQVSLVAAVEYLPNAIIGINNQFLGKASNHDSGSLG